MCAVGVGKSLGGDALERVSGAATPQLQEGECGEQHETSPLPAQASRPWSITTCVCISAPDRHCIREGKTVNISTSVREVSI